MDIILKMKFVTFTVNERLKFEKKIHFTGIHPGIFKSFI